MVGLVGVEARVQVRARAGREVTSAIQEMFTEPIDVHAKSHAMFERERFATGALFFNSPTCPSPRAACRIRLSVWGGAPPMSRLAGWTKSSVISHALLGSINLPIFIHV